MKSLMVLALAFYAASSNAKFAPIKDTTQLQCAEVMRLVQINGFQHFTTHGVPKYPRFATYFADQTWCQHDQHPVRIPIETLDDPRCWLGFVCEDDNGRRVE